NPTGEAATTGVQGLVKEILLEVGDSSVVGECRGNKRGNKRPRDVNLKRSQQG
ncbi:hypothetical protein HAX54_036163, partial [Datura stramonium]|nr:hypothetical protein [Datura stramonium]